MEEFPRSPRQSLLGSPPGHWLQPRPPPERGNRAWPCRGERDAPRGSPQGLTRFHRVSGSPEDQEGVSWSQHQFTKNKMHRLPSDL